MAASAADVRKFLYSHYFHSGLRQAAGTLLPPILLIGWLQQPLIGVAAAFGALCVSIIDQPGPQRHRLAAMLGSAVLGTLAALITGAATSWPWLLLTVVVLQTFVFGLFSALGRRGGMIGFACLLLMTLTMHHTVTPAVAAWHALATLGGGLWYVAFSWVMNRLQHHRQEQQTLAVALFATAEYVQAKSPFYDPDEDLDASYRALIPVQAQLAEKQQAARDLVLAAMPSALQRKDLRGIRLGNLFIDMIDLQETMLATYTDYAALRRALAGNDFLLFGRDAMRKLAADLDRIGMALVQNRSPGRTTGIRAELRAMEYEVVLLRRAGFPEREPEAWVVVIQVLRRLRTAARLLLRMQDQHHVPVISPQAFTRSDNSLSRFFSREDISLKRLASHLNLQSPHLRYALRLTLAVALGMLLGMAIGRMAAHYDTTLGSHGYWVVLTILVIMKPGFALSGQRNRRRLAGTLIGCVLVVLLLQFTQATWLLLSAMFLAAALSNGLTPVNYLLGSIFNTLLVLLGFHFLVPGSLMLIGERAIDAVIGSLLVWLCSWVLPYWESRAIGPMARTAVAANRRFLAMAADPPEATRPGIPEPRNDLAWRLARRDVYTAFANFADTFYRMMREPASRRLDVATLNDLLVQNHMLAAQSSSLSLLLTAVGPRHRQPPELRAAIDGLLDTLTEAESRLAKLNATDLPLPDRRPQRALAEAPDDTPQRLEALPRIAKAVAAVVPATNGLADDPAAPRFEVAHLTYELRQMIRSVQRIRDDTNSVLASREQAIAQRAENDRSCESSLP